MSTDNSNVSFEMSSLHAAYSEGATPQAIVAEVYRRINAVADPGIFIHLRDETEVIEEASTLPPFDAKAYPLWGIPFAIKDNIDLAGTPTTAACPAYAYNPENDAFVVAKLKAAGAIPIGKTNLDQFATGLVGVRSPFPPPKNALDPDIVPGGSSAGSAVAVALGLVSFALGTDTAGSGRVPAALNNIVGLKPTLGALSNTGVVPACRTLDTVSIFALSVPDSWTVFQAGAKYDADDAYARKIPTPMLTTPPSVTRIGVPDPSTREFFDDVIQEEGFTVALGQLSNLGAEIVELDFTPFYEVAKMLYEGAWVAERLSVVQDLLTKDAEALHPVTRQIISDGASLTAVDSFRGMYRLAELNRQAAPLIDQVDMLCVPTIPTFYSIADLEMNPVTPNSRFGTYTNFVNLLDMCGIAVPSSPREDGRPGSVTLLARAGQDAAVAAMADLLHREANVTLGATTVPLSSKSLPKTGPLPGEIALAVVGAHMSGLPLNKQLTLNGGRFLFSAKTAPEYRFYALAGGPPSRPGMVRAKNGEKIPLEVWALPTECFGAFIDNIPQPLVIGTVNLEDGAKVKGFLCEPSGLEGAKDITSYGGWRNYLEQV